MKENNLGDDWEERGAERQGANEEKGAYKFFMFMSLTSDKNGSSSEA